MDKKNKKSKDKKKEVYEIFKVENEKGEKEVKACGTLEQNHSTKEQINYQNKLLRNIFIVLGILIFSFVGGYFLINSMKHFEYRNVSFVVVEEIAPYRTELPVIYKGEEVPYYFYLRNDPRKLEPIPFDGELVFLKNMVINISEDFNCDGNGIIGVANLLKLYEILGVKVIKDENASCDPEGKYMFVQIEGGNETRIEQFGPTCYKLQVNDCEILEVTERFMIETFVKVKEAEI
jgi:hypothetical protein